VAYSGGAFSQDDKGIYVTTDRDSEFQRLAYIDLSTGQHTYLTSHINWDVDEFDLSEDGKHIAFVTNEDGYGVLHLLDTASQKEHVVVGLPRGIISGVRWHKNSRDLGFNIASARATSDAYSLDVETNQIDRWTTSETGGINTAELSEPELVHWKSWDSRTISGFLYRPPARRRPLARGLRLSTALRGRLRFHGAGLSVPGLGPFVLSGLPGHAAPCSLGLTLAAKCRIIRCLSQSLRSTPTARRSCDSAAVQTGIRLDIEEDPQRNG